MNESKIKRQFIAILILFDIFLLGFIIGSGNFPVYISYIGYWMWLCLGVSLLIITILDSLKKEKED